MTLSNARHHTLAALTCLVAVAGAACADGESAEADMEAEPDVDDAMVVETDRFATLDASGDSYLDVDEIAEWVDDEGVFTRWDIDRDSEIDEDEIANNAFGLWDQNDSGTISEEEWERGTELWYPSDYEVVAIADWDLDGDSELDADEFHEAFDVSALGEVWVGDDLNEETFKNLYFELYDTDDDGQITRLEWDSGLAFHGIPTS